MKLVHKDIEKDNAGWVFENTWQHFWKSCAPSELLLWRYTHAVMVSYDNTWVLCWYKLKLESTVVLFCLSNWLGTRRISQMLSMFIVNPVLCWQTWHDSHTMLPQPKNVFFCFSAPYRPYGRVLCACVESSRVELHVLLENNDNVIDECYK